MKGGNRSVEYEAWLGMLVRCYSERFLKKNPSYIGCTVCEEWHNFQVFAEWYTREDEYGRGYHLDKDILVKGNKLYSPKTCCLVPQGLNSFFSGFDGETKNIYKTTNGKFVAKISRYGKKEHLGTFETEHEASLVYSRAKAIRAKELALENLGKIRYKVFLAIINWEF